MAQGLTCRQTPAIVQLLELICQRAVQLQPCNAQVLCQLGLAQLDRQEQVRRLNASQGGELLSQAELSFRAALALVGEPIAGTDPPEALRKQDWFQQAKAEASSAKKPAAGTSQASWGWVSHNSKIDRQALVGGD
eukprot:m.428008 g.428008  ORF g.428008 m.428008 type:complete len:135 (-) comp20230_c0_seq28:125-529(-)